uniref:Uncharacterized protein n=1 Tax=Arundo donax TaxID=35708 RepID=A0A0A9HTH7_ARUDO
MYYSCTNNCTVMCSTTCSPPGNAGISRTMR